MKGLVRLISSTAVLVAIGLPAVASDGTPPTAVADYVDAEGHNTHIYVLANDLGDFDSGTLTIVSGPSRGSATVIAQGSTRVKYSFAGSEPGSDTFQYSICSSAGVCSVATVTVNIGSQSTTTTTSTTTTSPATTVAPAPPTTGPTPAPQQPPVQASETSPGPSLGGTTSPTVPEATTATVILAAPPLTDNAAQIAPATGIGIRAAGTTVGEPRGIRFEEDIRYLGRTGRDTIRLVAIPAIMVSGLLGFLMIGLPQNALGAVAGFLFGFRRKRTKSKPGRDRRTNPPPPTPL